MLPVSMTGVTPRLCSARARSKSLPVALPALREDEGEPHELLGCQRPFGRGNQLGSCDEDRLVLAQHLAREAGQHERLLKGEHQIELPSAAALDELVELRSLNDRLHGGVPPRERSEHRWQERGSRRFHAADPERAGKRPLAVSGGEA